MGLIKRSFELTQTIKNVGRFKEIISVLARNGFDEFIIKTGLHERIPGFVIPKSRIDDALKEYHDESWAETLGYRLRRSFEDLGPGFVKLGQLISSREDIFPPEFIQEMKKLQDKVKGISFEEAQVVISSSLGKPHNQIYSEINPTPIGTASIGVVYAAKLLTGENVVIKVRRPGIIKTIRTDMALFDVILTQIEKVSQEVRYLGLSRLIRDFGRNLESELDYQIEAKNCDRFKRYIDETDTDKVFYIPKVYHEFSSDEVLTLELISGIPFSDAERVNQVKDVIRTQLEKGLRRFVHSILSEGFFHADLHGGNFFLLPNHQVAIIDYGLMGHLSRKSRNNLIAIMYSLISHNYENLVYEFLDVADYDGVPDVDALIADVRDGLAPFVGLTVQQMNVAVLLRTVMTTLTQHQLYLPREWFTVFRAIITLDGVGKSLDMDFDIFGILENDLKDIIQQSLSKEKLMEDGLWIARDVLASVRGMPRHMRWFLREFSQNNYALEVSQKGYEKQLNHLSRALVFIGQAMFSAMLFFTGTYLLQPKQSISLNEIPALTWILWLCALVNISFHWWRVEWRKK